MSLPETMPIRNASPEDLPAIMSILDGAMLEVEATAVHDRLESDDVLVYVAGETPVGVIVLDGSRIDSIAVRRSRRDQGIGRRLVRAARDRRGTLTAEFSERVRPFYESLGFRIRPIQGNTARFRGTLN